MFKKIKQFFTLISLSSRRIEQLSSTTKGYYKDKRELMKEMDKSIGKDWGDISEIQLECGYIKIVRFYTKK